MLQRLTNVMSGLRGRLRAVLADPTLLAVLPALVLAAFWLGGEDLVLAIALAFPLVLSLTGLRGVLPAARRAPRKQDRRQDIELILDEALQDTGYGGRKTACFVIGLDDFDTILDRHGQTAAEDVIEQSAQRLRTMMRERDNLRNLDNGQFGVALAAVRRFDLADAANLARRLQAAVEEPVALGATTIHVSASIGYCLSGSLAPRNGAEFLSSATIALNEALRHGPSALRAYSPDMQGQVPCPGALSGEASQALDEGQFHPWFQPQLSTDTGRVTGFEALARWHHPRRGMVSPSEFLPALEQCGGMERLSEIMLYHALRALRAWDRKGFDIPHVGVNFAPEELRNPALVDRVGFELDRFELMPGRLSIEVLETVIATSSDDVVVRNISGLADMGCLIDLDDFGTGHASISSIRRLAVQRLKIDRSFVMKVDRDPEQQRMVSAILLMAERLGLDTLAEGVETAGEHAMLAQLGCGHVQGFGIARPMPVDQTSDWVEAHCARLHTPPVIGRQTG